MFESDKKWIKNDYVRERERLTERKKNKKREKKEWIGCMLSYKIDDIVVMF